MAFVRMYWGKAEDSPDLLQLVMYNQKLMKNKNKAVQARDLPLTSATTGFQSKHVYFQIQKWATLGQPGPNPEDWGWEICDNCLLPIMANMEPAPDYLLRVIRCSCKQDCSAARCSCNKHGFTCTQACKECKGICCLYSYLVKNKQEI